MMTLVYSIKDFDAHNFRYILNYPINKVNQLISSACFYLLRKVKENDSSAILIARIDVLAERE
jgi:hypothetical protein